MKSELFAKNKQLANISSREYWKLCDVDDGLC
jgi:hypothetical protein